MKRKTLFMISCLLLTVRAMAQNENVTISKETTIEQHLSSEMTPRIAVDARLIPSDYKAQKMTSDTAIISNLQLTDHYDGQRAIFGSPKTVFVHLEGEQKQFLNLASYNLAFMALGWRPSSKLSITGGVLALKQFSRPWSYGTDRLGARVNLRYSLTDRLDFNIWGQYITESSTSAPIDIMLPQTGAGASMVLDLGRGSQVGVSTEYRYDDKKDKLDYQSGGKLKLNF